MIIYNVTINIDPSIEKQWLGWMRTKHIREVLNCGCFVSARLVKVHVSQPIEGVSYATQYVAESQEKLQMYYSHFAPKLREEGLQLFGDKMLAFRTELEIIEEFMV
jgi:hypothetical protein